MKQLKISKKTAVKLHPEAPEWFREVLNETFGENTFKPRDWKDIKTFEDACDALGISTNSHTPIFDEDEAADEIAYKKLKVIVAAINQGWVPDWTNSDQYKYYPWFNLSSGSGFSVHGYGDDFSYSSVGSRLCFESKEKCLYAAEQFKDIYEDFFIIK